MPNRNQTGPRGEGPMTGRKMGVCNNQQETQEPPRLGLGRRMGRGRERGNFPRRGRQRQQ
jgi:hypothetical protein